MKWLIIPICVFLFGICYAEDNGVKGGMFSSPILSDTTIRTASDTVTFLVPSRMEHWAFYLIPDTFHVSTNDTIQGVFARNLRNENDRTSAVGTAFAPILWQTTQSPYATSESLPEFVSGATYVSAIPSDSSFNPTIGGAIQVYFQASNVDTIPFTLELVVW